MLLWFSLLIGKLRTETQAIGSIPWGTKLAGLEIFTNYELNSATAGERMKEKKKKIHGQFNHNEIALF